MDSIGRKANPALFSHQSPSRPVSPRPSTSAQLASQSPVSPKQRDRMQKQCQQREAEAQQMRSPTSSAPLLGGISRESMDASAPTTIRQDNSSRTGEINNNSLMPNLFKGLKLQATLIESPEKLLAQRSIGGQSMPTSNTGSEANHTINTETHINPFLRSEQDPKTRALALEQTTAARNLFYRPAKIAEQQLSKAADKLCQLMDKMPFHDMKRALCIRVTGHEGLMRGQSVNDVESALKRVSSKVNAMANDRAATIEILATIGAIFVDPTTITSSLSGAQDLADQLRAYLSEQLPLLSEANISEMKELGASSVNGPLKPQQRIRPSSDTEPLLGMHNLGGQADKALGISTNEALNPINWRLAKIDKTRVHSTTEPLSAHMSGSPPESLVAFDALLGDHNEWPYVKAHKKTLAEANTNPDFVQKQAFHSKEEADIKSARLAWATGYLVATGFHSAVEVAECALKYTGQNPRPDAYSGTEDAANWLWDGGGTSMIKELHESHSQ